MGFRPKFPSETRQPIGPTFDKRDSSPHRGSHLTPISKRRIIYTGILEDLSSKASMDEGQANLQTECTENVLKYRRVRRGEPTQKLWRKWQRRRGKSRQK